MKHIMLFILWLALMTSPATTLARTWFVEQDGSGEFTVIQNALDAAADGDTILIGPGWYQDYRMYTYPGGVRYIYANVQEDNITIIGSSPEETTIGPPVEWWDSDNYSRGINHPSSTMGVLRVENLKVINLFDGLTIQAGKHVDLQNCHFEHCDTSILTWGTGSVVDCEFTEIGNDGIRTHGPSADMLISQCAFQGQTGITFMSSDRMAIEGCFFDCATGCLSYLSSGHLLDSEIQSSFNGFQLTGSEEFIIRGNRISGPKYAIMLESSPFNTIIENNYLEGGEWFTIRVVSNDGTPLITNNDIIKGSGPAVELDSSSLAPDMEIDLRNNYWGTTDPDTIAEWIIDGNDDSSIRIFAIFEPFAGGALPSEAVTLDGVKALYRGAGR